MAHKFEHINKNKLDNEWRRENLPPLSTIKKLGLTSSDIVADIGCGIGYFTIPIAEFISKAKKVFALDTSEEMLLDVRKRADNAYLSNIITVKTDEYDLKLENQTVTYALIVNVLHEIEDKQKFIYEIKRLLKDKGKLAIIEWKKTSMEMGPSVNHRISKEEVAELLDGTGFRLINSLEFADTFYGFLFESE